MIARRVELILSLSSLLLVTCFLPTGTAAAGKISGRLPIVTAAQPGGRALGSVGRPDEVRNQPIGKTVARRALTKDEGAGPGWCGEYGGYQLGSHFDDLYACGPPTGEADPFDSVGFQCVELSDRFLWVAYGDYASNVPYGRDFVPVAHSELGIRVGTPGVDRVPVAGDIVSLWGDAGALPYGHTAVVTSVDVNAAGNGSIEIMEENGNASGSDHIRVSEWNETYGNANFDGGYYYYDHASWLELGGSAPPPPKTGKSYPVRPLGAGTQALAINKYGTVTGTKAVWRAGGSRPLLRPFIFKNRRMQVLTPPGKPTTQARALGVNNTGDVVVATRRLTALGSAYVVSTKRGLRWRVLPRSRARTLGESATGINQYGDVSGWESSSTLPIPSTGLVWIRTASAYVPLTFHAGKGMKEPEVYASDWSGDAIGTEVSRGGVTLPVFWLSDGTPYLLPGVNAPVQFGIARALAGKQAGERRVLRVVGVARDATRHLEAVHWKVTIPARGRPTFSHPQRLRPPKGFRDAEAEAISGRDWITGVMTADSGVERAFLWRPKTGVTPISSLLPKHSGWVVTSAAALNGKGQVAAQGFQHTRNGRSPSEGLLITLGKSVLDSSH